MPANEQIIFRKGNPEDVDDMTELDAICFSVPWSRSDFEKELTINPRAIYIVAETEEELVGYAGLWCIVDEGHITNVAVHPDYRQKGIGKELIETLLNEAIESADIRDFTLEVRVGNAVAIKLYEGFGFKEVGIRKKYYSDNKEDAAIMWLKNE